MTTQPPGGSTGTPSAVPHFETFITDIASKYPTEMQAFLEKTKGTDVSALKKQVTDLTGEVKRYKTADGISEETILAADIRIEQVETWKAIGKAKGVPDSYMEPHGDPTALGKFIQAFEAPKSEAAPMDVKAQVEEALRGAGIIKTAPGTTNSPLPPGSPGAVANPASAAITFDGRGRHVKAMQDAAKTATDEYYRALGVPA